MNRRTHRQAKTKPLVLAALMLAASAALPACNTVEGIGEDTASAGKAIDRAANDAKN